MQAEMLVLLVFASYIWAIIVNTMTYAFIGPLRRIFTFLGESAYVVFIASVYLLLLLPLIAGREFIFGWKVGLPGISLYLGAAIILVFGVFELWSSMKIGWRRVLYVKTIFPQKYTIDGLIVDGPYSMVRNPIYLCDFLILIGLFLVFHYASLLFLSVLYCVHIIFQARMEENELRELYGLQFEEYMGYVPGLLPKIW